MSGSFLPVIPKRLFDFSAVPTVGTLDVVAADRLQLLHWRELTLTIRVHGYTLTSGNGIGIFFYPQSFTDEEPAVPFLGPKRLAALIDPLTPNPGFLTVTIPTLGADAVADMTRIVVSGSRTVAGTIAATLSMAFASKDA